MKTTIATLVAAGLLTLAGLPLLTDSGRPKPNTDWLHDAPYSAFMHFLPGDARGLKARRPHFPSLRTNCSIRSRPFWMLARLVA